MKKVLVLAAVAVLFFATSCKKDYTCECKTTTTIATGSSTVDVDSTTGRYTKKDAKEWCDAEDLTAEIGLTTITTECELK